MTLKRYSIFLCNIYRRGISWFTNKSSKSCRINFFFGKKSLRIRSAIGERHMFPVHNTKIELNIILLTIDEYNVYFEPYSELLI